MRRVAFGLVFLGALCGGAIGAAGDWKLELLPMGTPLANEGCVTRFGFVGQTDGDLFLDAGSDDKARATIKLGGKVFDLVLVHAKTTGRNGPDSTGVGTQYDRVFQDKTGALTVETVVKVTRLAPEADAVEMAGTLTAKYLGETQTVRVDGGVGC